MSFDKIFDLTAGEYLYFYNTIYLEVYTCQILSPSKMGQILFVHRLINITLLNLVQASSDASCRPTEVHP